MKAKSELIKSPLSVVKQVKSAYKANRRVATTLGFLLGGLVPMTTYVLAHHEIDYHAPLYLQVPTLMVVGGLLYSATTVYTWGKSAFSSGTKAIGFVVLTEGTLVVSHITWLSLCALAYLVVINGIATGCNLALDQSTK
jgi:VIT1/CCC1 family predicted Fe2+/Mn2+ transporter